jgi:hypothetical protein
MRKLISAVCFLNIGLWANSQSYDVDSLRKETTHPELNRRINGLVQLSFAYINSNPDSAQLLAEQALQLSKAEHFTKGELGAINNLAYLYSNMGQKDKSLALFLEGLKTAEREHIPAMQLTFTQNLGNFYHNNDDPRTALSYFFSALDYAQHNKFFEKESILLTGVISCYLHLDMTDSARFYISKCQQSLISHPNSGVVSTLYGVQGEIELLAKNISLAVPYYTLSMQSDLADLFYPGAAESALKIAGIFSDAGKNDSAFHYAGLAYQYATLAESTDQILSSSEFLFKQFKKTGRQDSAFFYLQVANDVKDSLYAQDRARTVQELSFGERVRQQDLALKRYQDAQDRKSRIELAAIAIFIPTFFLLLLLISSRRVKRGWVEYLGIVALLLVFEFVNLLLHPYIVRLTHHNNIFMLLILVALAGVLVPIHHKLEHAVKHWMVKRNERAHLKKVVEARSEED